MIRQGYRGWANVDGNFLLTQGGSFTMPRSLDAPASSSAGSGEFNYTEGLAFPVIELPAYPQASWWTAANLQKWFQNRTTAPAGGIPVGFNYDDLSSSVSVTLADSSAAFGNPGSPALLNGVRGAAECKGAEWTLTFAKGEAVLFHMRFHGLYGMLNDELPTPPSGPNSSARASFADVTLGGGFAGGGIVGGTLTYSNNLVPNAELKHVSDYESGYVGVRPKAHNAGTPTASLVLRSHGRIWSGDNTQGTITVGGVVFTVKNPVCLNASDRAQQPGRVVRTYRFRLFARTGGELPVYIT